MLYCLLLSLTLATSSVIQTIPRVLHHDKTAMTQGMWRNHPF